MRIILFDFIDDILKSYRVGTSTFFLQDLLKYNLLLLPGEQVLPGKKTRILIVLRIDPTSRLVSDKDGPRRRLQTRKR